MSDLKLLQQSKQGSSLFGFSSPLSTLDSQKSNQAKQEPNDKIANKLLNNVDLLSGFSSKLKERLQSQEQEMQEKQKRQSQKQQDSNKILESKIAILSNLQHSLKVDLDIKQTQLRDAQVNTHKAKEDLVQLKNLKGDMVRALKATNQQELKQKQQTIQELQDEIDQLKENLKNARRDRRELEDQNFENEEMKVKLNLKLNELTDKQGDKDKLTQQKNKELSLLAQEQDNLQLKSEDRQEEKQRNIQHLDELINRLGQLGRKREDLQKDIDKAPKNMEELESKVDKLTNEIIKNEEDLKKQKNNLAQIKQEVVEEERRIAELQNLSDLLKKILAFEQLSRQLSMNFNQLEDKQKQLDLQIKDLSKSVKSTISESGLPQDELSAKVMQIFNELQHNIQGKNDIRDDLKIINSKILGKTLGELKIDHVNINFEKLQTYVDKIDTLKTITGDIENKYVQQNQTYLELQNQLKLDNLSKAQELSEQNRELSQKIQNNSRQLSLDAELIEIKLQHQNLECDSQIPFLEKFQQKISQFNWNQKSISSQLKQEAFKADTLNTQMQRLSKDLTNQILANFLSLTKQLQDQQERLKKIEGEKLESLGEQGTQLEEMMGQFESLMQKDKLKGSKELLTQFENDLDSIDKHIEELQQRLKEVEKELNKLDSSEDELTRHELEKQMEKLEKQLENQIQSKDELRDQVEKLKALSDEVLLHQNLEDLKEGLNNIKQKALPLIEEEVYELEGKLKKGLNRKRNQLKKECQDSIDKNKALKDKLQEYLEKIDQRIKSLEKEGSHLYQLVNYGDLERDQELEDKVKNELKQHRLQHQQLKEQRDSLMKSLAELEKDIELSSGTINSSPNSKNKDQIAQQWHKFTLQSSDLSHKIADEVRNAQRQLDGLEVQGQVLSELSEKYRYKDQIFRECQENQFQKQQLIEQFKAQTLRLGKDFHQIQEQLQLVMDCPQTDLDYQEKLRIQSQLREKIDSGKKRLGELQQKLSTYCEDLGQLKNKVVLTRDLQQILDDLNRLNLDFDFEVEDIKGLQQEFQELLAESKALVEENKHIKMEEAERELGDLHAHVQQMDQIYKETEKQLQDYFAKIQQGLKENIGDEECQEELKRWRQEAEIYEKELKQIDQKRHTIKGQERLMRDQIQNLKLNKSKATAKDIDFIAQNSLKLNRQAIEVIQDCERIREELVDRHLELDGFLAKQAELGHLLTEFDQILGDSEHNIQNLQKRLDQIADEADLLKQVLMAMESGTDLDYKLKEGFIKTELEDLQDIEEQLFKLDELKQSIGVQLQIYTTQREEHRGLGSDTEALQTLLGEAIDQLEKLQAADKTSLQLQKRLLTIRTEVGIADIPDLIQQREAEFTEFSAKLRKLEGEFGEIKKLVPFQGSPQKDIKAELTKIEQAIKQYRDDKVHFQRVLGQDLQIFLPQPQKLDHLPTLKDVIVKVLDLGRRLQTGIEGADNLTTQGQRLKRRLGGMDMLKRAMEVDGRENNQRQRLLRVKERLEIIGKGASDCDGYTSNTEEATFIDTLLSEIPEMKQKQRDALGECDYISNALYEVRREIEKHSHDNEDHNPQILDSLENLESHTDQNEKTTGFLEKLCDKLEEHFLGMDVRRKLEKRQLELQELKNIGEDFGEKLLDMQEHLISDIEKIQAKALIQNPLAQLLVDEAGHPVNLLEEMLEVQQELKEILSGVTELQVRNEEIRGRREEAQDEFEDRILRNSPFKASGRITNKSDVFTLLRANGSIKKKIIELIKQLKEVSKRLRDNKSRYQQIRQKLETQPARKLYKSVKGDIVDELFGEYINKLNCPVPIKRLGNNYYTFGTKKVFAKIINGKLVIRVGGGYMGIEEFMMYYGQQELQKIQKEEQMRMLTESDYTDPIGYGQGAAILGDDFMASDTEDESSNGGYTRMSNPTNVNIDELKEKLKSDSAKKKLLRSGSGGRQNHTVPTEDERPSINVVGIGDVRRALKKNLATYEESKSGAGSAMKRPTTACEHSKVEKELRKIEARVGQKLKQNLEGRKSPSRQVLEAKKEAGSDTTSVGVKKGFQSKIPGIKKQ